MGGTLAVTVGPASAKTVKAQITSAQAQLHALDAQAETASEHYDAARMALAAAQQKAGGAQRRLAEATATVRTLQAKVAAFAVAAYSGDTPNPVVTLTTGTPATFLDRMSSLQAVSQTQGDDIAAVTAADRAQQQAKVDAVAALAGAKRAASAMAADRNQVLAAAAKEKTILSGLQAKEAAIIKAARAARQRAARIAAQRAAAALQARQAAAASAVRQITTQPVAPPHISGSGGASTAVAWAYKEIGKPYQWGAAGPNSFDCSGLTMFAWAHAGVSLGHYTGDQWNEGTHVAASQLEPGDLVFFAYNTHEPSSIHHVGIYVGGGNMIEAPYTGADVRVSPYNRPDFIGAVRPG
jgi:cell wall-associated NlpC family hydrolase